MGSKIMAFTLSEIDNDIVDNWDYSLQSQAFFDKYFKNFDPLTSSLTLLSYPARGEEEFQNLIKVEDYPW